MVFNLGSWALDQLSCIKHRICSSHWGFWPYRQEILISWGNEEGNCLFHALFTSHLCFSHCTLIHEICLMPWLMQQLEECDLLCELWFDFSHYVAALVSCSFSFLSLSLFFFSTSFWENWRCSFYSVLLYWILQSCFPFGIPINFWP